MGQVKLVVVQLIIQHRHQVVGVLEMVITVLPIKVAVDLQEDLLLETVDLV